MKNRKIIRIVLSVLLLVTIVFFFGREFRANWSLLQAADIRIDAMYVSLSLAAILATYFLNTYCWSFALNSLASAHITFLQSISVFSTSNLAKYVPGRVWSFSLQMFWMERAGFSPALVLYVNVLTLYISLMTSLIVGTGCLAMAPGDAPLPAIRPLFIALVVFELCFILFSTNIINRLLAVLNKVLKRDMRYFATSKRLLFHLHLVYTLAAVCFGAGAYFLCSGMGFAVTPDKLLPVMSSMIISEVAGFIAVIAPGGLGVREGTMYLQLKGVLSGAILLLLPFATRLMSMFVEITLALVGLALYRTARQKERGTARRMGQR